MFWWVFVVVVVHLCFEFIEDTIEYCAVVVVIVILVSSKKTSTCCFTAFLFSFVPGEGIHVK